MHCFSGFGREWSILLEIVSFDMELYKFSDFESEWSCYGSETVDEVFFGAESLIAQWSRGSTEVVVAYANSIHQIGWTMICKNSLPRCEELLSESKQDKRQSCLACK